MTKAEELFHQIAAGIPDAKEGKMFGALCIKAPNGKAAAMFWKDNMIFKLEGEAKKEATSLDGAKTFEPADGRQMKGWTQLSYDYADKWKYFSEKSMDYVRELKK